VHSSPHHLLTRERPHRVSDTTGELLRVVIDRPHRNIHAQLHALAKLRRLGHPLLTTLVNPFLDVQHPLPILRPPV